MAYLFLFISIVGELIGTSMLKASQGFTKFYPSLFTLVAFAVSFIALAQTLRIFPLHMTYAIWSGLGSIATTVISVLIWKEKINAWSIIGITLIVIGVVILNLFGPGHDGVRNIT